MVDDKKVQSEVKSSENYSALLTIFVVVVIGIIGFAAIKGYYSETLSYIVMLVIIYGFAFLRKRKFKTFSSEAQAEIVKEDNQSQRFILIVRTVGIVLAVVIGYLILHFYQ